MERTEDRPLRDAPVAELRSRLESLLSRMDVLFKEVGPRLTEIGNSRAESELIYRELKHRGLPKEEDDRRPVEREVQET